VTVFSPNRRTETPKRRSFCQIGAPAGQKNRRFLKSPCKTWFLTAATRRPLSDWETCLPVPKRGPVRALRFPPNS
jgi:hypothetical protein